MHITTGLDSGLEKQELEINCSRIKSTEKFEVRKSSPNARMVVASTLGKEESSSMLLKIATNCGKRATVTNVVSKNVYSYITLSTK